MRFLLKSVLFLFISLLPSACIEKTDTEEEMPKIEILSPLPCDTLYFGEFFLFKIRIEDQSGLGNISMDVHDNFMHHNHGSHESCSMDEPKEAKNPYIDSWLFALPDLETSYILDTLVYISDTSDFDPGDYHFHLYVTDNEGYQTFTTMDVKFR